MVKVKICGITNLEDALVSVRAGCDALGFAFFRKSPRYVSPKKVSSIVKQIPPRIIKIGVFVNAREEAVKRIARMCGLDMLQFHGTETPEYCSKFAKYKVIKVFRVKDKLDLREVLRYKPFAYLFDTFVKSRMGGTGKNFDWKLIRHLRGVKNPVFLSGGLTAGNVKKAISIAKPRWVDVCSSIELIPGKKDHVLVRQFIETAKGR
ncbi:MAG: phosphoribosylanthranilate isomerase [Candidatus Omnitrophica bacterium]|nr:phosphoribosylanthranilate isomerase [Candidatus Omnitrophota bacterium]